MSPATNPAWNPAGNPRPEPRIGDAERDAAIRALGEHYAAGRISKEEFDERSEVAMRARTDSQLRPLFADLPPLYAAPPSPRPGQVAWSPPYQQSRHRRHPWWQSVPVLPLVIGLMVLAVLTRAWWLVFVVWLLFACRPRGHRRPH
jgi:hypothetical protein